MTPKTGRFFGSQWNCTVQYGVAGNALQNRCTTTVLTRRLLDVSATSVQALLAQTIVSRHITVSGVG